MGGFNWNLGADDADSASMPNTDATPAVTSSAPLSRRELRNRAMASSAQPFTGPQPAQELIEFFQVTDQPATSGSAAQVESAHTESAKTVVWVEPVTSTRRAARPRREKAPRAPRRASVAPPAASRTGAVRRVPRRKTGSRRTFFSKLFSVGAMLGVGAIMVSTSLPANAFYSGTDATHASLKSISSNAQSMKVASTAVEAPATRDSYTVSSLAEQLRLKYGSRIYSYTNDINGTIQWPFPIPVPISSGFGPRISPCGGCSSMHEGVDFTPGRGVAIGSIADGVVSAVIASHAGLGNHVIVDHVINGQKVQSVYGHMLDNSFEVAVGDQVKVAQTLGHVGSTGESTGAHLHLEIHINGVPVDPFAWLKANAN